MTFPFLPHRTPQMYLKSRPSRTNVATALFPKIPSDSTLPRLAAIAIIRRQTRNPLLSTLKNNQSSAAELPSKLSPTATLYVTPQHILRLVGECRCKERTSRPRAESFRQRREAFRNMRAINQAFSASSRSSICQR